MGCISRMATLPLRCWNLTQPKAAASPDHKQQAVMTTELGLSAMALA